MKTHVKGAWAFLKVHFTFYTALSVIYLLLFAYSVHVGRTDLDLLVISALLFRLHELKLILKYARDAAFDILKQIKELQDKKTDK